LQNPVQPDENSGETDKKRGLWH